MATAAGTTSEAEELRAEREKLLEQMRDANERLLLATIRADELAEAANAAREAAAANEERFRSLVTTSSAVVWRADADGRIEINRESWDTFVGIDVDATDPDGWLIAVHPHDHDRIRSAWAAARTAGSPYTCQHRLLRRNGTFGWVVAPARFAGQACNFRQRLRCIQIVFKYRLYTR